MSYAFERSRVPLPDKRRLRAQNMAHQVVHALRPWLDRLDDLQRWHAQEIMNEKGKKADVPRSSYREISNVLFDLFYATGVEVITDSDRAAAGLEHRHHYGMTDEELRIFEHRYIHAMLNPTPPGIVPKDSL